MYVYKNRESLFSLSLSLSLYIYIYIQKVLFPPYTYIFTGRYGERRIQSIKYKYGTSLQIRTETGYLHVQTPIWKYKPLSGI